MCHIYPPKEKPLSYIRVSNLNVAWHQIKDSGFVALAKMVCAVKTPTVTGDRSKANRMVDTIIVPIIGDRRSITGKITAKILLFIFHLNI